MNMLRRPFQDVQALFENPDNIGYDGNEEFFD